MLRPNLRRTLKPTLNNCMGGSSPPITESFVARLDGTQYWQLSEPIAILDGYKIVFTFVNTESDSNSYLLCANDDLSTGAFTSSSSGFLLTTGTPMTLDVDGNGSEVVTYDGNIHEVTVDVFGAGSFQKLCTRFSEERMLMGWIKSLVVRDELGNVVNEIPLTNKSQGATQTAIAGTANATMINYTPDVWELEGQPPQSTQQASFQQDKAGEESEVDEGDWSGSAPITYAYQWQLDGVDIIGATAKTLLVIAGMIGQSLRCIVTATNQYGSAVSITAAIVVTI